MLTFRPFDYSDRDYETCMALHNVVWPDDPVDEANYRHGDKVRPKHHYFNRQIAEIDDKAVGYGVFMETWWNEIPEEYAMNFVTPPDLRNRGYATIFMEHALASIRAEGREVGVISASTREDQPDAVRWLENRGFERTNRYPRSELQLDSFDRSKFAHYPDRMTQHGLNIQTLATIMPNEPQWREKLWELEWILEQDEPTPDPPKKMPFEEYVKDKLEHPDFRPESVFIALDGDHFAGISELWIDKVKPDKLNTGWTGVDRPYRGKGVATALKIHALDYAIACPEIVRIETDNHETNWMYQINMRLGFKPTPAYLDYRKQMKADS